MRTADAAKMDFDYLCCMNLLNQTLMKTGRLLIALAFCAILAMTAHARETYTLNDGWKFFLRDENSADGARIVNIPHTWNKDVLSGRQSYSRTTASYIRSLMAPVEWRDRRVFLRFHGVQTIADLFVNGTYVGCHRGGFTAFTFEITKALNFGTENEIFVSVSNSLQNDVLPTSSEMNMYGGIYRDVELIVTPQITVDPDLYGADGIVVRQVSVSDGKVDGTLEVHLSGKHDHMEVEADVIAPDGYVACSRTAKVKADQKAVSIPFTLTNPELWSPSRPNMYEVAVRVGDEEVRASTGFRSIEVTSEKKLTVNGKRVRVHGVTLTHDCLPQLSAYTEDEYRRDLAVVAEMGGNAVRSMTGPHDGVLYDMCDRRGVLVWIDIPFVQSPFLSDIAFYPTERYTGNAEQQVREIVYQNINHPSVAMWGVFSTIRSSSDLTLGFIRRLNSLVKKCDPYRPTVALSNRDGEINFITDLIVWQQNIGWNGGAFGDLSVWQDALRSKWGHLRQAISYGEDGNIGELKERSISTQSRRAPEAKHTHFHESYLSQIDEELFWGVWINTLFDFGSVRYPGGLRTSGLVTFDHYRRKDAFYLYKTLWNRNEKTLYIVGKNRTVRRNGCVAVRFYSSFLNPELTVNGSRVQTRELSPCVYISDSLHLSGENSIRLSSDGVSDEMTITIGNQVRRRVQR